MAAEQLNGEKNCGGLMIGTNLRRASSEPIGEMKKPGKLTHFAPLVMSQQTTKERLPVLTSGPEGLDHYMDIPATARLEVPTNNSGPQGLDHHVDIPATGSLEVPTNNSGPQGVGHLVDIPVTGSLEVTNNNSGPQDGNYANDCKLAAFGGLADCATAVAALMYKPPSSGEPVYPVVAGIVTVAGVAEIVAAGYVACDIRRRGAAGRKILYVSVFMLVLGIAVDIFAYTRK